MVEGGLPDGWAIEMGVLPGDFSALPRCLEAGEGKDSGGVLPGLRVQPQVCDTQAFRSAAWQKAQGAAPWGAWAALRVAGRFDSAGGLGGGGYPWSERLKAMMPLWLPWIRRRFRVSPEVERQLLSISARQMDRRLGGSKRRLKRRFYGRTKPGTLLKHHIPIRTDNWDVTVPGFGEVDLVSHSGNSGDGRFAYSLNFVDIHTAWVETGAILGKAERPCGRLWKRSASGSPSGCVASTRTTVRSSSTTASGTT